MLACCTSQLSIVHLRTIVGSRKVFANNHCFGYVKVFGFPCSNGRQNAQLRYRRFHKQLYVGGCWTWLLAAPPSFNEIREVIHIFSVVQYAA